MEYGKLRAQPAKKLCSLNDRENESVARYAEVWLYSQATVKTIRDKVDRVLYKTISDEMEPFLLKITRAHRSILSCINNQVFLKPAWLDQFFGHSHNQISVDFDHENSMKE